jgi:hypothetical protein
LIVHTSSLFCFLPPLFFLLDRLCMVQSSYLLFARRLAKFPEAWLLPLFPVLIRGAWHALQLLVIFLLPVGTSSSLEQSTGSNNNNSHNNIEYNPTVLRRVFLYLSIIQARIGILYLVLNSLEERIVNNPGTDCWYQSMLPTSESTCPGRIFDFSDHIVLYFAQILPIALSEVLHSFVVPYWDTSIRPNLVTAGERIGKKNRVIPTLLLVGIVHLYVITLLGVYKTSAFFHTGPEVLVGYMISLMVQIPVSLLQCTNLWPQVRTFFYGPSTNC